MSNESYESLTEKKETEEPIAEAEAAAECADCAEPEESAEETSAPKRITIRYDESDVLRKQRQGDNFKIEREYAKIERNEKGLIKRSGYASKVSYGEEFEKENLNKVLIFTVIMTAILLIGGLIGVAYLVINAMNGISILF